MMETITEAAVQVEWRGWWGEREPLLLTFTVPRPLRHDSAIEAAHGALKLEGPLGEHVQGFVTSRGRFVGREEAAEIATRAGQCKPTDYLFSEDVW